MATNTGLKTDAVQKANPSHPMPRGTADLGVLTESEYLPVDFGNSDSADHDQVMVSRVSNALG